MKKKILQKKIFLNGEGDNWLSRNQKKVDKKKLLQFKYILKYIKEIVNKSKKKRLNILEVGSSDGKFLDFLRKKLSFCKLFGIDPSKEAIKQLNKKKLKGKVASADYIPYKKNSMDIIYYGFCLYLCDKGDYKKIFLNAKRVLKNNGYLIIYDFFSKKTKKFIYKHDTRVFAYKMDFRKIFKKNFDLISHKEFNYERFELSSVKSKTIEREDLVAISLMKKN